MIFINSIHQAARDSRFCKGLKVVLKEFDVQRLLIKASLEIALSFRDVGQMFHHGVGFVVKLKKSFFLVVALTNIINNKGTVLLYALSITQNTVSTLTCHSAKSASQISLTLYREQQETVASLFWRFPRLRRFCGKVQRFISPPGLFFFKEQLRPSNAFFFCQDQSTFLSELRRQWLSVRVSSFSSVIGSHAMPGQHG